MSINQQWKLTSRCHVNTKVKIEKQWFLSIICKCSTCNKYSCTNSLKLIPCSNNTVHCCILFQLAQIALSNLRKCSDRYDKAVKKNASEHHDKVTTPVIAVAQGTKRQRSINLKAKIIVRLKLYTYINKNSRIICHVAIGCENVNKRQWRWGLSKCSIVLFWAKSDRSERYDWRKRITFFLLRSIWLVKKNATNVSANCHWTTVYLHTTDSP